MKGILIKVLNSTRWSLLVLGILFLALNIYLFSNIGIKVANDSPRFLGYADQMIATGFYFDPHEFWYIAYPLFLIVIRKIHNSLEAVVFAQYFFSIIGIISIYFASLKLFKSKPSSFLAGLFMILFFEFSIYNSYILTESLYISMICVSLFFLSKWYLKEFNWWTFIVVPLILIFTAFLKPTGVALIGALLGYVLFISSQKIESKAFKTGIIIALTLPFLLLINKMLSTFNFIGEYQRGDLIFGMFQYPNHPHYEILVIKSPEDFQLPNESHPPLIRLLMFAIYNPVYWLKMFVGKVFYLFAHVRPFWSTWHNLFSLLFLIPVYSFGFKGLLNRKFPKGIKVFSLVYIGIHALSVGMMTDDWDGRFLLPVLPVVFIWASIGIDTLLINQSMKNERLKTY